MNILAHGSKSSMQCVYNCSNSTLSRYYLSKCTDSITRQSPLLSHIVSQKKKKQVWIWNVGMFWVRDSTNPRCDSIFISHCYSRKIPKKIVLQPEHMDPWLNGGTLLKPLSEIPTPCQLHDSCSWTWALTSVCRGFPRGPQWSCKVLSVFPHKQHKTRLYKLLFI